MQRRSFLGSICAAVGGLFVGKATAATPERIRLHLGTNAVTVKVESATTPAQLGRVLSRDCVYKTYRLEPVAGDWDGTVKPIESVEYSGGKPIGNLKVYKFGERK